MYHIYQFSDPRTGTSIYIGLTSNLKRRIREHMKDKGSPLHPLIQELKEIGLDPLIVVLEGADTLEAARPIEKRWIQKNKPLLNTMHNGVVINERNQAEWFAERVAELMAEGHLNYREAILYMEYIAISEGDAADYRMIKATAQMVRQMMGGTEPFTESEILRIAMRIKYGDNLPW